MVNKQKKDAQYHYSSGKYKLKQRCDTTTDTLEWLKIKRLAVSILDEDVEQLEPSFTAEENVKWYNLFGKQFNSFL